MLTPSETVLTGTEALLVDAFDATAAAAGADRHDRAKNASSVWELEPPSIPKASLRNRLIPASLQRQGSGPHLLQQLTGR